MTYRIIQRIPGTKTPDEIIASGPTSEQAEAIMEQPIGIDVERERVEEKCD